MAPFEKLPEDQATTPEGEETSPEEKPAELPKAPGTLDVKMDEPDTVESLEYQTPAGTDKSSESEELPAPETPAEDTAPGESTTEVKNLTIWEKIKAGLGMGPKEEKKE